MPDTLKPGGEATRQAALLQALDRVDCRTVERLAEASGLERHGVVQAARGLITRGYAERAERGCYLLTDQGEAARREGVALGSGPRGRLTQALRRPRRVTLRDRLWRALRLARTATVAELLRVCDRDDVAAARAARLYLRALAQGGYIRRVGRQRRPSRWLLLRDTGPLAPALRRGGGLYDRNLRAEAGGHE